jgi:dephospho-CoA kinase
MIQLGITGGIGSGKTTLCKVLEHFGVPVYYADEEAKKIIDSPKVQNKIVKAFGKDLIDSKGKLDRKKLAAMVFAQKSQLEKLNLVVHPEVAKHYLNWIKSNKKQRLVAKEAAILFESGSYKLMDKTLTVYAPKELRIKRCITRSKISREEIIQRMNQQISEKEKIKRSDFVVYNDNKRMLIPQIIKLLKKLNYLKK